MNFHILDGKQCFVACRGYHEHLSTNNLFGNKNTSIFVNFIISTNDIEIKFAKHYYLISSLLLSQHMETIFILCTLFIANILNAFQLGIS